MNFFPEIGRTFLPVRGSKHGPLPPLLVAMTFVTGLVDAFSYLLLGEPLAGTGGISVASRRWLRARDRTPG